MKHGRKSIASVAALNKPAPKFNLKTIDGQIFSLASNRGKPVSVLEQYRSYIQASFKFVSYDVGLAKAYKLTAPEITYVIDKQGNIAFINRRALSYKPYKQQVEKAL